jgi:DNA-binding SARP family transcriptional activator
LEFRVLGPLAVRDASIELPLRRGKQRGLLAVLLLHPNEVVTLDRLVDSLWGDEPPATADHALEVYVSDLRRVLEPRGREPRILTRPGGYLVRIESGELDLARFERLCASAREAAAGGDAATAARQFRQAEALWSGPPLADLAREPFAPAAIARLEEARDAAIGDRIEVELALGRHAELVAELEALTRAEPLRERPHGQLMLALYRTGRQADALRVYRDLRARLVDDLGLEPGPDLQRLEGAILRQDAELDAPARVGGSAGEGVLSPPPTERKLVTVLVAAAPAHDPASGADPERRRSELTRFETVATAELAPTEALVTGLVGGGLMAAFGLPTAQEDHADRALRAALVIRDRVPVALAGAATRIGVATGEVIALGGPLDGASIAGSAVEVAARLAEAAGPAEILVDPRTVQAVRGGFGFAEPGRAASRAAGIRGVRRLVGRASDAPREPALGRTFVGRRPELDQLATILGRAIDEGEPRLATIVGEPGVGKSSLVRRWLRSLAQDGSGPVVRVGRCPAYGRGITYWPLAEILRDQLGSAESDPPEALLERLGDRSILGLTFGLDTAGDLHPMAAQNRLHDAWVALLDEAVAARPTILVVEDIHWAEAPLLDLLDRVVRDVDGPLMILATARPELARIRPDWVAARRRATTIWLEPLSASDAATMVADLLDGPVPAGLDQVVVDRAEGNPFFVEELLVSFAERGLIARAGSAWRFEGATEPMVVPDTVRSLLAARLDLLPAREKAALQAASVVGRRFDGPAIEELLGDQTPDFDALLGRDFIRRLPRDSTRAAGGFAFKHALIREVAYESLPKARRAGLHASYAERLERVGEGRDEHAAILAYHYAQAVRPEDVDLAWPTDLEAVVGLRARARSWSLRAAHLAVARYAIEEAVLLLEQALELDPPPDERSAIWLAIGRANVLRYDGVAFWTAMEQATADAPSDEARAAIYAELAFETAFRWAIWKRMPSREMVDGWIDQALALASPGSRARAVGLIASADWHPLQAGEAPAEAIQIAERLGDPALLSYALDARALVAFAGANDVEAQAWWERRAALADQIHDLDHLEDLYGSAITGNVALGRFPEARRFARLHDDVAMQLSPHHQVHAVAMLVELEETCGEWSTVLGLAARTERAVAANLATPCVRNQRSLLSCALAAAQLGQEAESERLEREADALAMEGYEAVFDPLRVRLAILRGDLDEVRRRLPETIPPPTKNYYRLVTVNARLDALLALGELERVEAEAPALLVPGTLLEPFGWRALGIARADPDLLEAAARRFDELGLGWHAERARAEMLSLDQPAVGPRAVRSGPASSSARSR